MLKKIVPKSTSVFLCVLFIFTSAYIPNIIDTTVVVITPINKILKIPNTYNTAIFVSMSIGIELLKLFFVLYEINVLPNIITKYSRI